MKFLKNSAFFLSFSLLLALTNKGFGQSFFKVDKKNISSQYQSISLGGGTSHYLGDLSPYRTFYYGLYTNVRWNASLNYTHYLSPNFGLRFGFTWARLAGDDFTYSQRNINKYFLHYLRNLSFRNDVKEFTMEGIVNLIAADTKNVRGREKFVPYVSFGLGLIGYSPKAKPVVGLGSTEKWVSLRDQSTAGQGTANGYPNQYSSVALVVPLGLGVRYKLNEHFDLSAELGLRISSTDYLDDVGNDKYPNVNDLIAAGIAHPELSDRGGETISAPTGKDRTPQYQNVINTILGSFISNPDPSGGTYKTYISDNRGTGNKHDGYLMTKFSIHYVISNDVKCPPIR